MPSLDHCEGTSTRAVRRGVEPRSRRINSDCPSASAPGMRHELLAAGPLFDGGGASGHGARWMMQSCAAAGEDQETSGDADAESFYCCRGAELRNRCAGAPRWSGDGE